MKFLKWLRRWLRKLFHRHDFTRFAVRIYGGQKEHGMNLTIFDGKVVKFVATPDHPLRADEKPSWAVTAGDPGALALSSTDPRGIDPDDPTGCTQYGTGAGTADSVVVTISCVRDSDGETVKQDAAPINIKPNPDGDVGGFTIEESAL